MQFGVHEWRGFKECSEASFQSWEKTKTTEKRKDVYLVVKEVPNYNLKLRYGKVIELKVRTHRDEDGVETWERCGGIPFHSTEVDLQQIASLMQGGNKQVSECGRLLLQHGAHVVTCHKLRRRDPSHEHVKMRLVFDQDKEEKHFESFCVEGGKVRVIDVDKTVREKLEACQFIGGYNSFLGSLLK
jgi:hypothetical protein